jgi:hypothetical protein
MRGNDIYGKGSSMHEGHLFGLPRVVSGMWLELRGAGLRRMKAIASCGEVNWLTGACRKPAPAFNPAHADVA